MTSHLGSPAPILRVRSLQASLEYYIQQLGFTRNWEISGMASVTRGQCTLFLTQWDQGHEGTWVWVSVGDTDALHQELAARGARVRFPPTNYDWGYEMQIEDLDGNVLRLAADPKPDVPFGPFLDAKGVLWSAEEARSK